MEEQISVIGLGYVGLPIALAFAEKFPQTVGFDINKNRVANLKQGMDVTREVSSEELHQSRLKITDQLEDLQATTFFIITVPTPIDQNKQPDLSILIRASEMIGPYLQPGTVIVYESTVYPGVTEEVCAPVLERASGLKTGKDFKLGYSPERINPGDKEHSLNKIIKVVAGQDPETTKRITAVYQRVITAGIHQAPSIRVAEAAKVIENTQRDLNIALMNELAIIFEKMAIPTADVLAAARTKWNFLPFHPGLVGGHCIGVDPYYLTAKAESLGYHPQVILAGRRINDSMGGYVAQKMVKMLVQAELSCKDAKVAILGLTFKENVPDLRNSRVPDIIKELSEFGIHPLVHDPLADREEAKHEYNLPLCNWDELHELDGIIIAVAHQFYRDHGINQLIAKLKQGGILIDVKAAFHGEKISKDIRYWSL